MTSLGSNEVFIIRPKIGIGRLLAGKMRRGMPVVRLTTQGERITGKIEYLFTFRNLVKDEVDEVDEPDEEEEAPKKKPVNGKAKPALAGKNGKKADVTPQIRKVGDQELSCAPNGMFPSKYIGMGS